MMHVPMPKFVEIYSDFICLYEKIAGGRDPIVNADYLYIIIIINDIELAQH